MSDRTVEPGKVARTEDPRGTCAAATAATTATTADGPAAHGGMHRRPEDRHVDSQAFLACEWPYFTRQAAQHIVWSGLGPAGDALLRAIRDTMAERRQGQPPRDHFDVADTVARDAEISYRVKLIISEILAFEPAFNTCASLIEADVFEELAAHFAAFLGADSLDALTTLQRSLLELFQRLLVPQREA